MPKRDRDFTSSPRKRPKRYLTSGSRFSNQWEYDVFLSFAADTRYDFADNVFVALDKAKIYTFKEDRMYERGKHLSSNLEAIERSRISIIIFSKEYADSPCCLDEIEKIVECMDPEKDTAIPVFYWVRAKEVRLKQTGAFTQALDNYKHEKKFSEKKLQSWSAALEQLGGISGRTARGRFECDLIEEIIGDILGSLYGTLSSIRQSSLKKGAELSNKYESRRLIANVRDVSKKVDQLVEQKQLLNATIPNMYDVVKGIILVMRRLCTKKVSVILDDINNCLEQLYTSENESGSRSKIILINRDKHALMNHKSDETYKVGSLNNYANCELSPVLTNIPSLIILEADHFWLGYRYHVKFEYLDYGSDHYVLRSASICIYDEFGIDGVENSNSMVKFEIRAIHTYGIEYLILLQDRIFAIGVNDGEYGQVYNNWVRLGYNGSVEPLLTKPSIDDSGYRMEKENGENRDNVESLTQPSSDDLGYSMKKESGGNRDSVEPVTKPSVNDSGHNMKMESCGNCDSIVQSITKPIIDDSGHNVQKESGGNCDNAEPITKPSRDDSGYGTKKESGEKRDSVEQLTKPSVDDSGNKMTKNNGGNSGTNIKKGFFENVVHFFKRLCCFGME